MHTLLQDLRVGIRSLRKTPLVTGVAILTLALGIGANSAIFSIVNAVLLQPLPLQDPDRLIFLGETSRQRNLIRNPVSPANYLDWKAQSHSFAGLSAIGFVAFTYSQSGGAVRVNGVDASYDLFDTLQIKPIAGRTFLPEDDAPGADNVVVVSESFWKNSLGGERNAIGRTIRLNSRPYTVIGVVPDYSNLVFGTGDLWKPLGWDNATAHDRATQGYGVIGRLRDNISLPAAQSEFQALSNQLTQSYPATNSDWVADLSPILNGIGFGGRQLLLLLAVVALVLLIACVNLASLFSARINARRREIATRLALGASRARLVRQFLIESLLLSVLGGAVGIAVAYRGIPFLISVLPAGISRITDASLDIWTLLFTVLISLAAGVMFGLTPGLQAARAKLHNELQDSARGSSRGARAHRFLDGLVVAEIALSMVLLVGAGLVLRSFLALRNVDPGFRSDHVLVNTLLVLPVDKYTTRASRQEFFNRLLDRIQAMPQVVAAGGITALPLQGNSQSIGIRIAGDAQTASGRDRGAVANVVTDGYFATMGIPLKRGRFFKKSDDYLAPHVALINDTLAHTFFQDRDPIGATVYLPGRDTPPVQIVGVVGSSRQFGLRSDPSPEIFTPFLQSNASFMYVVARSTGNPELLAQPIRREVAAIDPDQPVGHRTLEAHIENTVKQPRVLAELLGLFASLALILALVGIYGVTSYGVAQRTHEIGIRMSLGAQPRSVLTMVVGRTARLAFLGIAAGGAAAFALSSLTAPFLFGIRAADPTTYANTAILLLVVAMLASFIPARKASRVDPAIAMRQE